MAARPPCLGLSLAYFHRFVDAHGGRDEFKDLTTLEVCMRFVMPMTEPSKLSLVDHVRSQPGGDEYAKPAQWLISHSWSYKFLDVVDAIDNFCQEQELSPDTSFWFCMFANNQHNIGKPADMFDYWMRAFRTALEHTRKMVMVLSPWHDPETLKRTWCVYEVYLSIVLHARFEVALGKTQHADFMLDVIQPQSIQRMTSQINSSNSIATVPSDRDLIFALIEAQVGFVQLDRMVFDVIQGWILRALDKQAGAAATPEDRFEWLFTKAMRLLEDEQYGNALVVFQSCLGVFNTTPLSESTRWQDWLAQLYVGFSSARLHRPREMWEPIFDQGFPRLYELLGRHHFAVYSAKLEMGKAFCMDADFARGMPLMMESLTLAQEFHGDHQVYAIMHSIGMYLSKQMQLRAAEAMLRNAWEGLLRLFGPHHKEVLETQTTLAVCLIRCGQYRQAEPLMQSVIKEALRTHGRDHPDTLQRLVNLMSIERYLGHYDNVEAQLRRCEQLFERMGNHVWTAICRRSLGVLFYSMGDLHQAKTILETAHELLLKSFEPKHLQCRGTLMERYVVDAAMPSAFDTVAKVEAFQKLLHEATIKDETWCEYSCHQCYAFIQGDIVVCAQCPTFSIRYCTNCLALHTSLLCGHNDGPWTWIAPPTRFLSEKKTALLAESNDNDITV